MNQNNHYGEWLNAARKAAKLTQKQLAEKADISESYVSTLENGSQTTSKGELTRVEPEKCDRISIALGKSIIEGRRAAGYAPLDERFSAIAAGLENLSEENRAAALAQMQEVYNQFVKKEAKRTATKDKKPRVSKL